MGKDLSISIMTAQSSVSELLGLTKAAVLLGDRATLVSTKFAKLEWMASLAGYEHFPPGMHFDGSLEEVESMLEYGIRPSGWASWASDVLEDFMLAESEGILIPKRLPLPQADVPVVPFDRYFQTVGAEWFENLTGEIDGQGIPAFDDILASILPEMLPAFDQRAGGGGVGGGDLKSVVFEVLNHLPRFPDASMADVLEMRYSLKDSLAGFRGELIRFWMDTPHDLVGAELRRHIELRFRQQLAPAIADLERAIQANRFLRHLKRRALDKDVVKRVGLEAVTTLGLGAVSGSASAASALAIASIEAGSAMLGAADDWVTERDRIQSHPLFLFASPRARSRHF